MKPKKLIIAILCILLMFFGKFLPPIMGLSQLGMAALTIFVGTLVMMLAVDTVWSGFVTLLASAATGLFTFTQAVQTALGNSIFWFLIIGTMVLGAMERTGLLKRLAFSLIRRPFVRKSPWMFISAFLLSAYLTATLMNLTATVLLFLALCANMMQELKIEKGSPFAAQLMASIMIVCVMANGMTALGHSVPLVGISLFEGYQSLSIAQYSIVGFFIGLAALVLYILMLRFVFRMDAKCLANFDVSALVEVQGPMSKAEKIAACMFVGIILYWLVPSFIQNSLPGVYKFMNSQLSFIAPFIIALILMCLIHIDGKPMMDVKQEFKNVPWGPMFMIAIAMFLGSVIQNKDAGLVATLSAAAAPLFSGMSPVLFVGIISLLCIILTQFTSNTLCLMLAGSVAIALMGGGAIAGVHGGAMSLALGIAASCGFATAPGSAPAAILAGQGWIDSKYQMKMGFISAFAFWIMSLVAYVAAAAIY